MFKLKNKTEQEYLKDLLCIRTHTQEKNFGIVVNPVLEIHISQAKVFRLLNIFVIVIFFCLYFQCCKIYFSE